MECSHDKEKKGDLAFMSKSGRPTKEQQSELISLKQENKSLKEEVDILKKAAAYFARELKSTAGGRVTHIAKDGM